MTTKNALASVLASAAASDPEVRSLLGGVAGALATLARLNRETAARLAARTPEEVAADERRAAERAAAFRAEEKAAAERAEREKTALAARADAEARKERLASGAEVGPEYLSAEAFAEFRMADEEETFSGDDVRKIAAASGAEPAAVRAELLSFGLRLAVRKLAPPGLPPGLRNPPPSRVGGFSRSGPPRRWIRL